jgi:hypothetical protein
MNTEFNTITPSFGFLFDFFGDRLFEAAGVDEAG